MRSTERYKLLCKMVKSFIRHQQSKQLTSCMFYFSTIPVGFMQKEKKNVQFFWFIFFLCWSAFCSRRRCLRFYLISLPSQLPLCASNFNWLHGGYGGACHPGIFSLLCTQNKQKKNSIENNKKSKTIQCTMLRSLSSKGCKTVESHCTICYLCCLIFPYMSRFSPPLSPLWPFINRL